MTKHSLKRIRNEEVNKNLNTKDSVELFLTFEDFEVKYIDYKHF